MTRQNKLYLLVITMLIKLFHTNKLYSPVQRAKLYGQNIFIKRDDLLLTRIGNLSGNKARKFLSLIDSSENFKALVSYGGIQSNAMLALAKVARHFDVKFTYFSKGIPKWLRSTPSGNYGEALKLGAKIIELDSIEYENVVRDGMSAHVIQGKYQLNDADNLWIPQGGACELAEYGSLLLAEEIKDYIIDSGTISQSWKIVFASGTGTTALFVSRYFKEFPNIEIVAVPCVGDSNNLKEQMQRTDRISGSKMIFPTILDHEIVPNRVFAQPYLEHFEIWRDVYEQTGVEFDLIYAPKTFECLKFYLQEKAEKDESTEFTSSNIMYYHCGGIEGNNSQLSRYKYKFKDLITF